LIGADDDGVEDRHDLTDRRVRVRAAAIGKCRILIASRRGDTPNTCSGAQTVAGTDCSLRDPLGNPIRFTRPPEEPVAVPSAAELRAESRSQGSPPDGKRRRAVRSSDRCSWSAVT
jgi:hypothetical protein